MTETTAIDLWSGKFGDDYTERNQATEQAIYARRRLFLEILRHTSKKPKSVAEIGAGGGANLKALRELMGPSAKLIAVEPNAAAREAIFATCATLAHDIYAGVAEDIPLEDASVDLAFTSGVLIHIPPDSLGRAMDEIYRVSNRYIVCVEYFSPNMECVPYRGQTDALWKADYGSLYLDRFEALNSVAYGFAWKRDTGLDNLTWHLMEKRP